MLADAPGGNPEVILIASGSEVSVAVDAHEKAILEHHLARHRFNQRRTAAALGLSYDQLRHALKRHKLQDTAA